MIPKATLSGVIALSALSTQTVVDLSGSDWTLLNLPLNISVPASLPSQAHLDLYAAQVIGDPYYGSNDFSLRWVAESNWTYLSAPIAGLSTTSDTETWLLFNGLDTFSSISFCGQHVAATNNQFRQYYFDVSSLLINCTSPVLSINFGSAPLIAAAIAAEPGQETWPYSVEIAFEFLNRQFIRKEQSDFGWDWGPGFAPAGPWQPAYIIQLASKQHSCEVFVRNVDLDVSRLGQLNNLPPDQGAPWLMNASLDILGHVPEGATLLYSIAESTTNHTVSTGCLTNITTTESSVTGTAILDPAAYELWWPRGLGPQSLYNIAIELHDSSKRTLASVNRRMGFRTIVLNLGPVSADQISRGVAPGNNWHFEINGHEFYAKGSNFIPPDAFWPRVTEAKIRQLFDAVITGNQNMLRVWASGAYTPDFIYDIADEAGVLMWSEFEFGDALYPIDQGFLDNVREEASYNVRRINHHPSLALWAGGNELESLELQLVNNTTPEELERYRAEYEQLFLHTLLPIVYANTKSISYIPSSTTNGYLELNFRQPVSTIQRYDNKTEGALYGDTDYYNYNSALAYNYSSYPVGRFANEFGYHSMPSLQTWQQAVSAQDLHFNSTTILLRNHHYPPGGLDINNFPNTMKGMGEMTVAAQRWYPVPNKTDSLANFSAWCHTTQIFQADFYRSQIQFYRRGSGFPNRQLGSLYWQLEDIWQAPSWAGIEYDGRWKVLHYGAKDIYQPVIISPFYNVTTGELEVYVTSDLWSPASGVATFEWYKWDGTPITNVSLPSSTSFTVGALNTTRVLASNTNDLKIDFADAVLYMNASAKGTLPNSPSYQTFNHENFFTAVPLSQAKLVDPGLRFSYSKTTKNFTVEATAGVAAWTWLDYPAGALVNFDSNGFWLLPGRPREIGTNVKSDSTGGEWVEGVTLESLWNNTMAEQGSKDDLRHHDSHRLKHVHRRLL